MNQKEAIAKLVKIFTQIQSLDEEASEVKAELKELGVNVPVTVAVAKAIVVNKVDSLVEKSEVTLETIEIARS